MQAHNQPTYTNSNAPHTLDAIYLRPAQNMQGGHELMDLTSGLVITHANVTEIPVTDLVIKAVEKMGYDQGFPITGMKFTNRQGQIYLDNDWITGVDYDEYEDEENPEDPEDDENDDNNGETDYEEEQQELAEILHEPPEDNPTIDNEQEENEQQEDNEEQQDNEEQEVEVDNEEQQESEHEEDEPDTETELRRSTRTRKEVDRHKITTRIEVYEILKNSYG